MYQMIYRYIYKITCTAGSFNGKFYFGQHSTKNLDDNYKGSGTKLGAYYKKYPNDYIKEIIAFYNTDDELSQAEYNIIHPHINDPNCLNLCEGGGKTVFGTENKNKGKPGWNKGIPRSEETRRKISESNKGRISPNKGKRNSDESNKKRSESLKGNKHPMYGKHNSDESNKKRSEKLKGHAGWNKGLTAYNKGKHLVIIDGKRTYR